MHWKKLAEYFLLGNVWRSLSQRCGETEPPQSDVLQVAEREGLNQRLPGCGTDRSNKKGGQKKKCSWSGNEYFNPVS